MEKKPNIRENLIYPKFPKSLPQIYNKDISRIEEIYTKFVSSEYEEINKIISSGEVLNFRDEEGRSLIHAIITNDLPDMTESKKLNIIKELVEKNVSVNAMDKFNRNPLHYASDKGYTLIIEYLISIGCDKKLIDNDGNAPIHIFVDKFISECKKNELFNPVNKIKNIESSPILNKINDIIKTNLLSKIQTKSETSELRKIVIFITLLIQVNKYYKEKDIDNIFKEKNNELLEFLKLITKTDITRKLDKVLEEKISGMENDIDGLYNNFMDLNTNTNYDDIEKKLNEQEEIIKKNITENSLKILKSLSDIKKNILELYNNNYLLIDKLFKITYYAFFLSFSPWISAGNKIELPFEIDNSTNNCPGDILPESFLYNCDSYSVLNTVHRNKITRKNSLYCKNGFTSIKMNEEIFCDNFIDDEYFLSNKFYIYDNNEDKCLNYNYMELLLKLLIEQLDTKPNKYYDHINKDIIDINTFSLTELEYELNWNLEIGLDLILDGLPLMINKFDFETEIPTLGNDQISSDKKSIFLLTKFPKKISSNEDENKELNNYNISKIKEYISTKTGRNISNLDILTDIFSFNKMNQILIDESSIWMIKNRQTMDAFIKEHPEYENILKYYFYMINYAEYLRPFPPSIPSNNNCDSTAEQPELNEWGVATFKVYSEKIKEDFENIIEDFDPRDPEVQEIFKKAWINYMIFAKNLPNGYSEGRKNIFTETFNGPNVFNNTYKPMHHSISVLCNYCNKLIDLVIENYMPKLISGDFNNLSIYFNTFIFSHTKTLFTDMLINLGLLKDYILKIDKNKFDEIIKKFNEYITNKDISKNSKNLLNEHLGFLYENIREEKDKYEKYIQQKKYEQDFNNIYEKILEILNIFNEQSEQFNKLQSISYAKNIIGFIKDGVQKNINDFYFNKFNINYGEGFPKDFNSFINIFVKVPMDNQLIIQKLVPYYNDGDFNKIYNFTNNKRLLYTYLEIKKKQFNGVNFDNGTNTINKNYTTKKDLHPFEFEKLSFQYDSIVKKTLQVIPTGKTKPIITTLHSFITKLRLNDKYKIGYYRIDNNATNDVLYLTKKNYQSKYIKDGDTLLDIEIDDSQPYVNKFKSIQNSFSINKFSKESLSIVGINNVKEIINSLIIKITNLIILDPNVDNYFDFDKSQLTLDSKESEQLDKIVNEIKSNNEIKNAILFDVVSEFVKMIIITEKNIETRSILELYIKSKSGIFNKLSQFNIRLPVKRKKNIDLELKGIIKDKLPVLEIIFSEIDKEKLFTESKYIKVIGDKCVDMNMVDKLIHMNMRIEDINGNTILNKLISQYNIYGIKKIICLDPELKTYKNSREQTSIEYLLGIIKTIQSEYIRGLETRLNQYSEVLQNQINQSENYKELSLDSEEKVIYNLILMCIYMFNEFIWMRMYNFPNGWTLDNKNKITKLLQVGPNNEDLLIKLFNQTDLKEIENLSIESINKRYSEQFEIVIQEEITDLENKIAQLDDVKTSSKLLTDVDDIKNKYRDVKRQKEAELKNLISKQNKLVTNIDYSNVMTTLNSSKDKIINQNSINYEEYDKMVVELIDVYYKMIKLLNQKVTDITKTSDRCIANSQLLLIGLLPNVIQSNINSLVVYDKKIIDGLYAEFEDLDRYDDTEYNTVNYAMLNIIKINIVNVMTDEMTKLIYRYMMNNYDSEFIRRAKTSGSASPQVIYDGLFNIIKDYLYTSVNVKLKTINPDKEINLDILKTRLVKNIYLIFGLTSFETDSSEFNNVINLINFYNDITDNIAFNAYQEMIKLLVSLKKISLLEEIYELLSLSNDEIKTLCKN